jgi:hypothetical protein
MSEPRLERLAPRLERLVPRRELSDLLLAFAPLL